MNELGEKISQEDVVEPKAKEASGLELARTPEMDQVVDTVNQLTTDVENDRNVKVESLLELDEALGNVRLNFGVEGETITIEELKNVPDVEKNARLYEKINTAFAQSFVCDRFSGSRLKVSEITYLTPGITRKIVSVYESGTMIDLDNLSVMTDEVAEILGQSEGVVIRLGSIKNLTVAQLRKLLAKTDEIVLNGLDIDSIDNDLAIVIGELASRIAIYEEQFDQLSNRFSDLYSQFLRIRQL